MSKKATLIYNSTNEPHLRPNSTKTPIKKLNQTILKGTNYLFKIQEKDGSWNGPLSSRLRETFLIYQLSKMLGWEKLYNKSSTWLETNKNDLGVKEEEIELNKCILNILNKDVVNFNNSKFYHETIARKTVSIFSLCVINNCDYVLPSALANLEHLYGYINHFISKHKKEIKGWALTELYSALVIIGKQINVNINQFIDEIIYLKDQSDNWFNNPATTAIALIAIKYSKIKFDFEIYKKFFEVTMQEDGGWSYCTISNWDTGLAIETLNMIKPSLGTKKALNHAYRYIRKTQNQDGGWGFESGLESESDTSSIILHAIRNSPEDELKTKALKYFKNLQFRSGKYEGLWPVWRKTEKPSPEVVGHIILALENNPSHIKVEKAKNWLNSRLRYNYWHADWGRNIPYSINAIVQVLGYTVKTESLIKYILINQNIDGGWGAFEQEESNPSATANSIKTLKLIKSQSILIETSIQNGLNYLIKTQLKNGTWPRVKEVLGPRPFVYADDSSTHNFVMQALLQK